jgi:hypothetical protein
LKDAFSQDSVDQLWRLLRRVRAHARLRWIACVGLWVFGATALLGLALLGLAARGIEWTRGLAPWLLIAAGAVFVLAGPLIARLRWRSLTRLAHQIAPRLPTHALRAGFIPAVELGEHIEREEPQHFSKAFAQAHIETLAARVVPVRTSTLLPVRPLGHGLRAGVASLGVCLLAVLFFSDELAKGARFLASVPPPEQVQASREPITGDIELTYRYPAYMRRDQRVVANTSGEIAAPLGTEVTLRTRADRPVERATIVLVEGAGLHPLAVSDGRDLTGTFTLTAPGAYFFRFEAPDGKIVAEGPPLPIAIEPDAAPSIDLRAPMADVEVEPTASVEIAFEAEDDFGVESVALLYKLPGAPTAKRLVLQREESPVRRMSGEHDFDLAPLGLMAGDTIAFYLEALDGDLMSGPKSGVSATRFIQIYSRADHHRQLLARLEEDWDKLLHLLADRLEGADRTKGRSLSALAEGERVDTAAIELGALLQARALELDEEGLPEQLSTALDNIGQARLREATATARARKSLATEMRLGQRGLSPQGKAFARASSGEIDGIERDALYLEMLLDQQRTEDLLDSAAELQGKQRELASLLERLRGAPDDETKARVFAEIARLKERMAQLIQRMGALSRSIQDAHVNAEALREMSEAAKAMDAFDRMQDLLHRGEIEEAMKALDEIGQTLDTLQRQLEGASQDLGGETNEALGRELQAFSAKLDALTREQEALLQETQQVRQAQSEARQKALRDKGEDFLERLRGQVREARERIDRLRQPNGIYGEESLQAAKSALDRLGMALDVSELGRATDFSEETLKKLDRLARELERQQTFFGGFGAPRSPEKDKAEKQDLAEARERIESVHEALAQLQSEGSEALSEKQQQRLRELAERESALRQKVGEVGGQMKSIDASAPIFPDEAHDLMRQIDGQMESAEAGLRDGKPSRSARSQRAALDQLGALKQGLKERGEQGQGQGAQAQGSKVPWPWGTSGRADGRRSGQGRGGRSDSAEKIKVPKPDSYQVPESYRREILDAMKAPAPERYQDQVRRYYEEIVK